MQSFKYDKMKVLSLFQVSLEAKKKQNKTKKKFPKTFRYCYVREIMYIVKITFYITLNKIKNNMCGTIFLFHRHIFLISTDYPLGLWANLKVASIWNKFDTYSLTELYNLHP